VDEERSWGSSRKVAGKAAEGEEIVAEVGERRDRGKWLAGVEIRSSECCFRSVGGDRCHGDLRRLGRQPVKRCPRETRDSVGVAPADGRAVNGGWSRGSEEACPTAPKIVCRTVHEPPGQLVPSGRKTEALGGDYRLWRNVYITTQLSRVGMRGLRRAQPLAQPSIHGLWSCPVEGGSFRRLPAARARYKGPRTGSGRWLFCSRKSSGQRSSAEGDGTISRSHRGR
jgi:hypothetical protein